MYLSSITILIIAANSLYIAQIYSLFQYEQASLLGARPASGMQFFPIALRHECLSYNPSAFYILKGCIILYNPGPMQSWCLQSQKWPERPVHCISSNPSCSHSPNYQSYPNLVPVTLVTLTTLQVRSLGQL